MARSAPAAAFCSDRWCSGHGVHIVEQSSLKF
jgi:hypothetical protein